MQQYPKHIKRLIREYVSRAYEAELGRELEKLEQHFATWRNGEIGAEDLKDLIHEFHQGPAREYGHATTTAAWTI